MYTTQHIPPIKQTFLEPDEMEATLEVETPPMHSGKPLLIGMPDLPPRRTTAPAPYSTTRLPRAYPLLWDTHQRECSTMQGMLLLTFTVFTLVLAATISLTLFAGCGLALCLVLLFLLRRA